MKYKGRRQSSNVNDRRSLATGGTALGGVGLIIALVYAFLSNDLSLLFNLGITQLGSQNTNVTFEETQEEKELAEFVSVVLADTEDAWHQIFEKHNFVYEEPEMVLFKGNVQSGCGMASSNTGPFYCPADQKVYLDLSFHQDLKHQFGATGDFAMAYVVAHEVGHHVQTLLGITEDVNQYRNKLSEKEFNKILKRQELQADYLAGVWAYYLESENLLDVNDINEAIEAASAVGDDRIQEMSMGYVVPDKFTHGTSAQRVRWFKEGYRYGDLEHGDTFSVSENDL